VSLTIQQRAQVLSLLQVEGVSVAVIAGMTGLSRFAVRRVLHRSRRQDVPAVGKAAAMRPSSEGRVERQLPLVHAPLHRKVPS
jgi:DNA-directed RNA polymerase specialized sigma24 family protein